MISFDRHNRRILLTCAVPMKEKGNSYEILWKQIVNPKAKLYNIGFFSQKKRTPKKQKEEGMRKRILSINTEAKSK